MMPPASERADEQAHPLRSVRQPGSLLSDISPPLETGLNTTMSVLIAQDDGVKTMLSTDSYRVPIDASGGTKQITVEMTANMVGWAHLQLQELSWLRGKYLDRQISTHQEYVGYGPGCVTFLGDQYIPTGCRPEQTANAVPSLRLVSPTFVVDSEAPFACPEDIKDALTVDNPIVTAEDSAVFIILQGLRDRSSGLGQGRDINEN